MLLIQKVTDNWCRKFTSTSFYTIQAIFLHFFLANRDRKYNQTITFKESWRWSRFNRREARAYRPYSNNNWSGGIISDIFTQAILQIFQRGPAQPNIHFQSHCKWNWTTKCAPAKKTFNSKEIYRIRAESKRSYEAGPTSLIW